MAAEFANQAKMDKYSSRYTMPAGGASGEFVPFAMETGGLMHKTARSWLAGFLKEAVGGGTDYKDFNEHQRADYGRKMQNALTTLGVALQRRVARTLLHHTAAAVTYPAAAP